MSPARRPAWRSRVVTALATHRVRSYLMVGFYAGILVAGVLGVVAPSASVEATLPDRAAVVLWTLLYGFTAPVAAIARLRAYYRTEALALLLIIAGTGLHGVSLINAGVSGLQTGTRLIAGLLALLAIASALYELSATERDGNLVVDPQLIARAVDEEVARTADRRRS